MRVGQAMRTALSILVLLAVASSATRAEEDIEAYLERGLTVLLKGGPAQRVVALGNVVDALGERGSPFARYVGDKIGLVLSGRSDVTLFDHERVQDVIKALQLRTLDLVDPSDSVHVGRLRAIESFLSGRYYDRGQSVELFLRLTSVETGTIVAETALRIPSSVLPPQISRVPGNIVAATATKRDLDMVLDGPTSGLKIGIWTTRGNGATYKKGEELCLNFVASADCYLKLYHIDTAGRAQLIFPNRYQPDNSMQARRVYAMPDSTYPFKFELGPPYGLEFIKAMASTRQFEDIENAFDDLGHATRSVVTRGLTVKKRETQMSETMTEYTIVE